MKNPFSKKITGLKIIIVGCGKVGATLVERLSKEDHDITIIDTNADVVQKITSIRCNGHCRKWFQLQYTDGSRN